jgi:hypothetical protein
VLVEDIPVGTSLENPFEARRLQPDRPAALGRRSSGVAREVAWPHEVLDHVARVDDVADRVGVVGVEAVRDEMKVRPYRAAVAVEAGIEADADAIRAVDQALQKGTLSAAGFDHSLRTQVVPAPETVDDPVEIAGEDARTILRVLVPRRVIDEARVEGRVEDKAAVATQGERNVSPQAPERLLLRWSGDMLMDRGRGDRDRRAAHLAAAHGALSGHS